MDKVQISLSVFFEDPFYIGICERRINDQLSVCKITFGAEPKDYDIQEYILKGWQALTFSPGIYDVRNKECSNPKRRQRAVKRQLKKLEIGTKSQQALKLQHTQDKSERNAKYRQRKEERNEKQFALRQVKRKEKHKGR
ncbi:YjdF family protein [Anaerocolumna sp. MB42-C2]|uniref:YjdF family protein n=1 Tax=Anaerocolumna sp. MB42-C2 TaxID=3070997 RepID=UPI0027E0BFC6|nr:YjdF family protein [Anaerocolumna sp. MB42-C2]WMJ90391.1 YjdF family protein [Anaerocolumna sp. MB42-C2]